MVGIELIGSLPRTFPPPVSPAVSHLYAMNPMRPHKLLRPGELSYFVREADR